MKHSKRLLSSLFYVPKYEKVSDVSFSRIIVSSVLGILLSIFCLAGLTWAWFSGSSSSAANSITAAEFKVKVKINGSEITSADGKYTLNQTVNTVTVTADGSATTGYCIVKFGENTYHTIQIFKVPAEGKPQSVTFTVNSVAGAKLEIIPQWGTCADDNNETLIEANRKIENVSKPQTNENNETGTVSTFKAENNAGNSETEETPQALTIDEPQQKTQATTSSKEENSTQSTVNAPTSQVSNVSSEPTSEVSTVSSETASTEKTAVSKTESKQETVGGDTQPLTESSSITSNVTSNNTENTTAEIENRQENAISEDGTGLNR